MSNCPGCDNSSTTYSRCNPPVSTNCVFYQGPTKICENDTSFSICKGDVLSNVQEILFEGICDLKAAINVSDIQFECSHDWVVSNKKTLHTLLQHQHGLAPDCLTYVVTNALGRWHKMNIVTEQTRMTAMLASRDWAAVDTDVVLL